MNSRDMAQFPIDAGAHLAKLQSFLTMPRETLPNVTAREAGRYLRGAAERLGLEFAESAGVAPIFTIVPREPETAVVTLFQTWHAESAPAGSAAVGGAERLALGAAIAGLEAATAALGAEQARSPTPFALVVAPSSSSGSHGLGEVLHGRREKLGSRGACWIRIVAPSRGPRRRVFLGARGRVVIGLRGGTGNPYRARDTVVEELRSEAYGPRPLDFELIRKLAAGESAMELLGDASAAAVSGGEAASAEDLLRRAIFDPVGEVVIPPVPHPDRPRAWLTFETAEAMEAEPIARRIEALSGGGHAEVVEHFPWDRANLHHPAIHALLQLSKARADGAEIWPSSPWATPSGVFTRTLGAGLCEWGVPLPAGTAIRFPKPEEFEALAGEAAELLARTFAELTR